jgi:hypothetical protein
MEPIELLLDTARKRRDEFRYQGYMTGIVLAP